MKVIVGLGNPGMRYARTRHNIGFRAVDAFVRDSCGPARIRKTPHYILAETSFNNENIAVLKPLLFMNRSGHAVSKAPFNFLGGNDSMLVVHDDVALEFGTLRFRPRGSAGGHKGLKNIIDVFGTEEVFRLKLGISQNRDMPLEDYVLMPFNREESRAMPDLIERAAEAIGFYLDNDIDAAMRKFNTKAKDQNP
jgi:peptidyl-tRNA hydrolase, PTH1 family